VRSLRAHWERTVGAALVIAGAVLVAVGYVGVRGARYAVDEISYLISGGIGGVLAVMIATTLLINGDRRKELAALDRLAAQLEGANRPERADHSGPVAETDAARTNRDAIRDRINV
jgi:hypothetical protein